MEAPEDPQQQPDDAPAEAEAPEALDGAQRPHPPLEALGLLGISLLVFVGASWLGSRGPGLVEQLAPALLVLAWIVPAYAARSHRGGDPFVLHRLLARPKDLGLAAGVSAALLLLYVLGFAAFQGALPTHAVPWGEVLGRFAGDLIFVALPEEYFFRGVLQPSLERRGGPRQRLLGAPVGRGLVLASALFALAHVILQPDPRRLAVFFPALWFGWLRSRTDSLLPGIVAHALANAVEVACFGAWE